MSSLENFFRLSPDLFCLLNSDGYFVQLNPAWESSLGWAPEQLEGQAWLKLVHSEDIDISQNTIQQNGSFNLINRYCHKDGNYRWLSWSGTRSTDGLIYAVAKDITAQQQEIEALTTEQQSLYGLLDQLPAFLYLQPKNYGVGFYNQRFREVFSDPEGRHCYETIAGLNHPCPTCPTFRVFDTNAPQLWEWHDIKTGKTYQIYDYPFVNRDGEPMVVEMGLDITAVKEAEAELRKAHAEMEQRVIDRTAELTLAMESLQQRDVDLTEKNQQLEQALWKLKRTQFQLVQAEKISSLGQLVAGVAHEVNNPVSFISGNLHHSNQYVLDLLAVLKLYQQYLPNPPNEIQKEIEAVDLDYLIKDLPQMLSSMQVGIDRIRDIMQSLRNFSRTDEAGAKLADISAGLESTLLILQHRLKATDKRPAIEVIKDYGELPPIECFPGQINQVFMNILANAIDALEEHNGSRSYAEIQKHPNQIQVKTELMGDRAIVRISDNGSGIPESVQTRMFDPFFTTKPVGKGTGLGLAISHQVVTETHNGMLSCISNTGEGTEFVIQLPLRQSKVQSVSRLFA